MEISSIIDTTRHDTTRHDTPIVCSQIGKKYKLAYIIPTKNSADFLDGCLEAHKNSFLKFNAAIYVLDANDDDSSLRVYEKHKADGILYEHLPGTSIQYRFFHAINNIDAEYICLGKDNQFPTYDGAVKIMEILDKGYDMVQTTPVDSKHLGEKEYHNIGSVCVDCAHYATLFGIVFFRKAAYKPVTYDQFCEEYGQNEWFFVIYYYDYPINASNFRAFHCTSYPYPHEMPSELQALRKRKGSWWAQKENYFRVALLEWLQAVYKIKCISFDEKKYVIQDQAKNLNVDLDIYGGWRTIRMNRRFDRKICTKYKYDIIRIAPNLNYRIIYLISVIPVPLLKSVVFVVHSLKQLFKKH